jgi:hypothetical protein
MFYNIWFIIDIAGQKVRVFAPGKAFYHKVNTSDYFSIAQRQRKKFSEMTFSLNVISNLFE